MDRLPAQSKAMMPFLDRLPPKSQPRVARSRRVVYIHAGTHKTGTTSIQSLLAENSALLETAGLYVPRTARIIPNSAGHHNLAWELNNPYQFDPAGGTLEGVIAEIEHADPPAVCISSEEIEFLAGAPGKLEALADAFRRIGYEPHAVVYLRPQADYLESLYAEIIKRWTVAFDDFYDAVRTRGLYGESRFDYAQLLHAFETAFGADCLHVRPYRSAAPPDVLLQDFLSIVGAGQIDLRSLHRPERLNPKLPFGELLALRAQTLAAQPAQTELGEDLSALAAVGKGLPFGPLTLREIVELLIAFARSNELVRRRYGVWLTACSWRLVWREVIGVLRSDPAAVRAKRHIRTLFATKTTT